MPLSLPESWNFHLSKDKRCVTNTKAFVRHPLEQGSLDRCIPWWNLVKDLGRQLHIYCNDKKALVLKGKTEPHAIKEDTVCDFLKNKELLVGTRGMVKASMMRKMNTRKPMACRMTPLWTRTPLEQGWHLGSPQWTQQAGRCAWHGDAGKEWELQCLYFSIGNRRHFM